MNSNKPQILIHSQYYPPEIGAPQVRLSELAERLSKQDIQVTVLTAMPNYPLGKIHSGYRGFVQVEQKERICVIHGWIYPTQSASFIPRLVNYFSFVLSSLILGILMVKKVDYVFTESPPLFLGIAGYLLSRVKRARWIFNVSDLWPESAVRLGVVKSGGIAFHVSEWLESFCYRKAYIVSGQSKSILENISKRFQNTRTYHLSNGADTKLFHPNGHIRGNKTLAIYAGLHGLAQGLDQVLLAASNLEDLQSFQIDFIGDGPEKKKLLSLHHDLKLQNVRFLDPLPRTQMPSAIEVADFCIIPLKLYLPGAVPSKLYEAMASSKAVVLIAEGEAAEIVQETGCGIVVQPGDINSLSSALRFMHAHPEECKRMGAAGRKAATEHFDREAIVNSFALFLQSI